MMSNLCLHRLHSTRAIVHVTSFGSDSVSLVSLRTRGIGFDDTSGSVKPYTGSSCGSNLIQQNVNGSNRLETK